MTSSSGASGIGIATITADGTVLDTWFPAPELNADAAAGPVSDTLDSLVRSQIEARAQARADKDWATADRIRDALAAAGVVVEDGADGATWRLAD